MYNLSGGGASGSTYHSSYQSPGGAMVPACGPLAPPSGDMMSQSTVGYPGSMHAGFQGGQSYGSSQMPGGYSSYPYSGNPGYNQLIGHPYSNMQGIDLHGSLI